MFKTTRCFALIVLFAERSRTRQTSALRLISHSHMHSVKSIRKDREFCSEHGLDSDHVTNSDIKWKRMPSALEELHPDMTLSMGQCFNWKKLIHFYNDSQQGVWVGMLREIPIMIKQSGNSTYYADLRHCDSLGDSNSSDLGPKLQKYFQLRDSLQDLYRDWSSNCKRMQSVTECLLGVRVVDQDPWECLVSFICSSNNNIKRITLMLDRLRYRYGTYICTLRRATKDLDSKMVSLDSPWTVEYEPVVAQSTSVLEALDHFQSPQKPTAATKRTTSEQSTPIKSKALKQENTGNTLDSEIFTEVDQQGSDPTGRTVLHLFSFPSVESIAGASESDLRALGMGYRAKFLTTSAQMVLERGGEAWLSGLATAIMEGDKTGAQEAAVCKKIKVENECTLEFTRIGGLGDSDKAAKDVVDANIGEPARDLTFQNTESVLYVEPSDVRIRRLWVQQQLMELHGVGRKVADCVSLFSMQQSTAVPVDTHVWDIAMRDYAPHLAQRKSLTPAVYEEVGDIFRSRFGPKAGWAHSVLFAAELPDFRDRLPAVMQHEMKLFLDDRRIIKEQAKAAKKQSTTPDKTAETPPTRKLGASPKRKGASAVVEEVVPSGRVNGSNGDSGKGGRAVKAGDIGEGSLVAVKAGDIGEGSLVAVKVKQEENVKQPQIKSSTKKSIRSSVKTGVLKRGSDVVAAGPVMPAPATRASPAKKSRMTTQLATPPMTSEIPTDQLMDFEAPPTSFDTSVGRRRR